ncbi:MAG: hypothetical protein IT564_06815 [Rhodospirillales bacterium]|nr:hypothetical protein [Rhodospirillales bacterium]
MATFEIAVYNQAVREKLKLGERHRELKDEWADIHYVEIEAEDMASARRKAEGKFPQNRGFVIADVTAQRF